MNSAKLNALPIQRVTLLQFGVLFSVSGLIGVVSSGGTHCAGSFFAGGLIAVLPQAWFAARVFRHRGAQSAKRMVRNAYSGEVGKFMLSMAGFAALFVLMPDVNAPAVFTAFVLMLVIQVLGTAQLVRRYTP